MKRGSALLIVLGMLAFMLFSGLAFSVYMRQTRLPSSFLRRTTVTRELAKGALAMAIADINSKIGNDLHPGVNRFNRNQSDEEESQGQTKNTWYDRVFIGAEVGRGNATLESQLVDEDETIPVLTLEGVAYLPPSLINEARYFFRRTPTAIWHKFAFDAGRYAYAALDVSDYFDVNKMVAGFPRSSAGSSRISLAHIFEGNFHRSAPGAAADEWDNQLTRMKVRRVNESDDSISYPMPLVSLADFNLALGTKTFGDIKSPFVHYIDSRDGASGFYPGVSDTETPQSAAYRSMTFVTDSYNAPREYDDVVGSRANVEGAGGQPFTRAELQAEGTWFQTIFNHSAVNGFGRLLGATAKSGENSSDAFMCRLGMCQLYDYLDKDNVPVSLAVPTVERVPMICGAKLTLDGAKLKITRKLDPAEGPTVISGADDEKTRKVRRTYRYFLSPAGIEQILLQVMSLYPFRNDAESRSFKLDGTLGFFLHDNQKGELKLRYSESLPGNPLRAGPLVKRTSSGIVSDGIVCEKIGNNLSIANRSPEESVDAVTLQQPVPVMASTLAQQLDSKPILEVTFEWEQKNVGEDDAPPIWEPETPWKAEKWEVTASSYGLRPLDSSGKFHTPSDDGKKNDIVEKGRSVVPTFALWLRVLDNSNGKTVDMVPASMIDDELNVGMDTGLASVNEQLVNGNGVPLIKISTSVPAIKLTVADLEELANKGQEYPMTLSPSAIMVGDPRFNHNPCSWRTMTGAFTAEEWVRSCGCDGSDCDGDVFMATSGQEYLQSHYELAHMLRLKTPFSSNGSTSLGELERATANQTEIAADKVLNENLFWKTYRPYPDSNGKYDDFEGIPLSTGDSGMRINPYSDSEEVLMAAFANTPADWRYASTNEVTNPDAFGDVATFNRQHAWCEYASEQSHRISWDTLCDFAGAFSDRVRSTDGDWDTAFRNLGWDIRDNNRRLAGAVGEPTGTDRATFTSVDRKFLYGFWHECFAARQQLFLIFVRAEPMMMGGGAVGMSPPQLGSRAVALVWRDPRPTAANTAHPVRILFYHPLD